MRGPNESEIELQILGYLNFKCRHFAIKNPTTGYYDAKKKIFRKQVNPYAINGGPDIYCWLKNIANLKGVVVSFEVKTKIGEQSIAQKSFEARVKECGAYYFIVRSIEDVESALNNLYSAKD